MSLTQKHMGNLGTIMLVVIPGWDDFNNTKALRLAKDLDKAGTYYTRGPRRKPGASSYTLTRLSLRDSLLISISCSQGPE